jgi:phage gp46-like protein
LEERNKTMLYRDLVAPIARRHVRRHERPDRLYASLSAAKQTALVTCLLNDGLQKRAGWWGDAANPKITGVTVADLARDGLLAINSGRNSAWLTDHGSWLMSWHPKTADRMAIETGSTENGKAPSAA